MQLTDALFAKLGGWEVVKQARGLFSAGRVTHSEWEPPLLRGSVQEGSATYRAGLVIHSDSDAENLCSCRASRQRGLICAHSVAVGLHYLKSQGLDASPKAAPAAATLGQPASKPRANALRRSTPGEKGDPLEIFLILPPNFSEAIAKGRIMLYLEGQSHKGRLPLNALPADTPFTLDPPDEELLTALETLNEGETPAMLLLNTNQFVETLPKLIGHPRISLGKSQKIEIIDAPATLTMRANLEPSGEILLRLAPGPGTPGETGSGRVPGALLRGAALWVFTGNKLQPLGLPMGLADLLNGPMRIARRQVPLFLNREWPKLAANCQVKADFALEDFVLEKAEPTFRLHLEGGLAMLQAKLDCFYGESPAGSQTDDPFWLPDPESPTRYLSRNFEAEQGAIARLARYGFTGPDGQGRYHLKGQNLVLNFFAREYPRLEKEWRVRLEERLERSAQQNLERIEPRFQITPSGEQWFDLHLTYDTRTGERFSPADIQRLLLSGQSHARLKNGRFALLDTGAVEELQEVLLDCAPVQGAGSYRLANTQAGFLEATLSTQPGWQVQAPAAWKERAAKQSGEVKPEPLAFGDLESVLRSYQKEGAAWLHFLRANGFGGILADEMGLGKTVQVLALLDTLRRSAGAQHRPALAPSLVVCPTSLVSNWAAEAARFTPAMRVLMVEGPSRHERFAKIPGQDLVITSYALLRRDAEKFAGLQFDTLVLDEAQHIKNRQTQNAQSVKAIRSQHRLVLTGTPLENSVLDLWSIFDFLMPGYLGNAQDFRERYEVPIAREKNLAVQNRLARRLRPFLLRRLKREVAADLPEKLEQVSFCDLTERQRALYQQILDASRREIVNAVESNGMAKSRMVVLTALLRLRQICCDLRLLKLEPVSPPDAANPDMTPKPASPCGEGAAEAREGQSEVIQSQTSGKLELYSELLEEILDGGHRVLVFSQFTSMLALLRQHLEAQALGFCYLDGATRDRAEVVQRFQRDPNIPVFLISLKAGGLGLNLTAADTVIHFDPWWNPAVEAQATDRAHRIGQKKVVTSYKLIARGTVEEKILNLQARKRALIQGMLHGEEQLTESLNWEEIQELLAE